METIVELLYPYWMNTPVPFIMLMNDDYNPFNGDGARICELYDQDPETTLNNSEIYPSYREMSLSWDPDNLLHRLNREDERIMYKYYDNLMFFNTWALTTRSTYRAVKMAVKYDKTFVPVLMRYMDMNWGVLRCGPVWIPQVDGLAMRVLQEWIDRIRAAITEYVHRSDFDPLETVIRRQHGDSAHSSGQHEVLGEEVPLSVVHTRPHIVKSLNNKHMYG